MAEHHGSETRRRTRTVLVRFNDDEHACLTDAMTRTGKSAATLLRETFLMADNHMLLPDLLGVYPQGETDG